MPNDTKYITFGKYYASDLQLRELADNILIGDIGYASDMLTLFENQESERLQELERNFNAQEGIRNDIERRDSG